MKVIFSARAKADLREIVKYLIDNEGKNRADKILSSFNNSIQKFVSNSSLGSKLSIPGFDLETRRLVVHKTYSIIYKVSKDRLFVLRIWLNSRNPSDLGE